MNIIVQCPNCKRTVIFDGILVCVPCYRAGRTIHLKPVIPPGPPIWGWAGLLNFTGIKEPLLRRALAYYGFPKPTKVRHKSAVYCAWDEGEVRKWLVENCERDFVKRSILIGGEDVAHT